MLESGESAATCERIWRVSLPTLARFRMNEDNDFRLKCEQCQD